MQARTHTFYTGSRHGRSHSEGLAGSAEWGVAGGWGGVTQVHNKYDAELERVQDGEQKRRLGGRKKRADEEV